MVSKNIGAWGRGAAQRTLLPRITKGVVARSGSDSKPTPTRQNAAAGAAPPHRFSTVELDLGLGHARGVRHVHQVHNAIHALEVLLPQPARWQMARERVVPPHAPCRYPPCGRPGRRCESAPCPSSAPRWLCGVSDGAKKASLRPRPPAAREQRHKCAMPDTQSALAQQTRGGGWRKKSRRAASACVLGLRVGLCCTRRLSRSMCSNVVLPALSRPRKRILASLFSRPSDCRMPANQFHKESNIGALCFNRQTLRQAC